MQAIIWTHAGIVLIGTLGTNFNENLIKIHTFSFDKIHLKMSSGKWRPFCLGLNVLKYVWSSLPKVIMRWDHDIDPVRYGLVWFQLSGRDRVWNLIDRVRRQSYLRPSVLFWALYKTSQGHIADEIRRDWRCVLFRFQLKLITPNMSVSLSICPPWYFKMYWWNNV